MKKIIKLNHKKKKYLFFYLKIKINKTSKKK